MQTSFSVRSHFEGSRRVSSWINAKRSQIWDSVRFRDIWSIGMTSIPYISIINYLTFFQGDLAKKKIYPTLWWLFRDNLLPVNIKFIGYARSDLTVFKLRESFEKNCKVRENEKCAFDDFIKKCSYVQVNLHLLINRRETLFQKYSARSRHHKFVLNAKTYHL